MLFRFARSFALTALTVLGAPALASAAELDPNDPEDAVALYQKVICGTLDADVATQFAWWGSVYSRRVGEPDRHLFDVQGINVRQCQLLEDPDRGVGFRSVSREVMIYLDPETGEVLDSWENPWTGETVEVLHVANDPVNMHAPIHARAPDGTPFRAPLEKAGLLTILRSEIPLFYPNPLGGDFQPYVGGTYQAMEIFNRFYDTAELFDAEDRLMEQAYVSWARIAQWLPWMEMGGRPGWMIFNSTGYAHASVEDVPEPLLSTLKERFPLYLTPPPADDPRPNETSWTVFKTHIEEQRAP